MARQTLSLTATQIKNTKPKEKKYKLSDGGGLFLQINTNGSKLWRLKYRIHGKEKEYAIGVYPDISLAKAREKREELRRLIADGIDPNEEKKQNKLVQQKVEDKKQNTFYNVSQEWWVNYEKEVSEAYHIKQNKAMQNYIYPFIKNQPIEEVKRSDILVIIKDLKNKGLLETAKRVFILLNQIFRYAVVMEHTPHNIIADLDTKIIIGRIERKSYATFTQDKDIKGLLLSIDEYSGDYTTKMALKMLPYVFVRSFNIRHCEWSEIDFIDNVWRIPAEKMKVKEEFILPLPPQVIKILEEIRPFSGEGQYVFPSFRAKDKPMSDNTIISAIRRMGYTKDEFVPHGFRAMFSTIAYEKANEEDGHSYTGEVIEALLAHKEPNKVKGAYNRAEYLNAKRELMQWYSDYLDVVKNS
ncbi:MAG: integrase [Arcobacteraceae bacterium]|jgi:integrase